MTFFQIHVKKSTTSRRQQACFCVVLNTRNLVIVIMSWLFGYSSTPEVPAKAEPAVVATAPPKISARRERTDQGPTFTSTKCPPGTGLENSCELPFGFVWTPMAELEKRQNEEDTGIPVIQCPTSSLPPVLCLTCLSYLNPHCTIKYSTGIWTCALCGAQNVLPKRLVSGPTALLTPALTVPMVEYHQQLPMSPDQEDICTIVLVVDANLDRKDALGVVNAVEQVLPDLEATPKIQLGLIVFDQAVAMYQLGIAGVASADVYTMDDEEQNQARQAALEQRAYLKTITSKEDLESLSQCLSAVFGVSVDSPKQTESRMEILKKQKEARMRQEQMQKPVVEIPTESPWVFQRNKSQQQRCTGEALQCAMDLASISESRTSRVLLFTNGSANMGEGNVVAEDDASAKNKKKKTKAVHASQMSKAITYYDALATMAAEMGIAVDVFCAGYMELGLPAYQALVGPSGGYVLPHSTFDSPNLVHNLGFCLKFTYISRTNAEIPVGKVVEEPPKSGLTRFFRRKQDPENDTTTNLSFCIIDIRTDSFVSATHLVGPGELMDESSSKSGTSRLVRNERAAFAEGSKLAAAKDLTTNNLPSVEALDLSLTRIRLPRYDPLATISVMVQVNDTIVPDDDDHAFFQMTARYISQDGKTVITRVFTHRFPVAESVSDYVKNLDDEVVSVLLAKGAVYRSVHGREETEETKDKIVAGDPETLEKLAYDAQLDLDATIQRISGAFRLLGLEEKTRRYEIVLKI